MDARKGKDAVTYKLVPMTENALAYMDGEDKQKLVDLQLVYKIQKTVGERVSFTTLKAEGMTLTVEPSFGEAFADLGDIYDLGYSLSYDEKNPVSSYAVTLKKGDDIVDQRIVAVTLKPKVAFDIDAANGEIRSDIANVRGDVSSFRKTIGETQSAVGNLSEDFTRFKQTANEFSLTVNSGARPNLLWGSDLDLDGVDVSDKAAVERRLGVGLVDTRMDGGRFRYLKGEGVDGSDALMFRSEKGVARVVGLCFGVARELRVRPGSVCTMSAWVAFDSHGGQGSVFCDMESWNEAKGGFERVWATPVKADHQYDSKDVARWTRCRWTFRVGGSGRVRFYLCAFTDKSMCDLWLCRPKLEEGDKATPWREYDRTADELLASGLSLKDKKFTATADNFEVRNNKGERTFMVDSNGMINNGLLRLDGLDAKRAVIKNLRFQSDSVTPYFVTEENMKEFAERCARVYGKSLPRPLMPFDVATFFVFLAKPEWYARLDEGYGMDFTPRGRDAAVKAELARGFRTDYFNFARELFWHNMVGRTVTIANATDKTMGFGVKLKTRVYRDTDRKVIQIGGRLDDLPFYPRECVEPVTLLPGQMASFKYMVLSGAPTHVKEAEQESRGYFLLQDLFDFSYYQKLFEVGYDTEPGFNLFDKKYLDLFVPRKDFVEEGVDFPKEKRAAAEERANP